ncbi:exocyst complex component Sec6 [Sistotremastrum niveocremeum HHB9708]|uniref:Exocyst complex component Sec6 n=2 Tax=Sistotremastraceae TaxID=3402574 RepID=A0A164W082_9AGAM|nr:exocyst complex component Sec6 [Sistotremastrum niveocremeum HHB9708]KZT37742.1 exocyst complex component Sec6 [Sistotremastrum suecicum HHB10207 ss-3]
MATQTLSAAQAVGEMLQIPDDLMKISALRKKLEKEKASIDAKLKSGVKEQLDATRDGLRKLLSTRNNVQAIKDEMSAVERSCMDPKNAVKTFEQISRVSAVHRNFAKTEEMVNSLMNMYAKIDALEEMLAAEVDDIPGPAPNILAIHYQINQLEAFRNETMYQAKKASADSRAILERWFERLNVLIKAFEDYIWTLARNVLPIVRAGYPSVVVKLAKIAEVEGKEDEKAIAIKLVKKAAKLDAASKFRSMQANARGIKHYRPNLTKAISQSIKDAFATAYDRSGGDPHAFLDDLGWIYKDLIRIQDDVVNCFPPSWDMFSFYVREYHQALDAMLKKIVAQEPDAGVILTLHAWIKEYKKSMKELEIPPELLEPPLLDGKEQTLIDDYLGLIVKKLEEWTANLMRDETREFTARENPPEIDGDGQYGLQGAVIMFKMVNQQCDAAADSGQGSILAKVVEESARLMRSTQDQWTKLLESEYKGHIERPDEIPPGLVDYVIALANDQIRSADFAEALAARLEPLVSEKYKATINEKINEAIDGYLDVAKKCVQTLIDLIFNDLKSVTKLLFTPPWYDGIIQQIVLTMQDYMGDCQAYLNPTILELLVEDLLDAFLITYLTALGNASKLKMPATVDRIKDDIGDIFQFFSGFKPASELETSLDVVDSVLSLLEASKSIVFLSFWQFAKVHGPNLPFVEGLMKARDDLDRSAVSEVMESVKRKVKEENIGDPPEPTIMKKIMVQSVFQRLLGATTRS